MKVKKFMKKVEKMVVKHRIKGDVIIIAKGKGKERYKVMRITGKNSPHDEFIDNLFNSIV